MWPSSPPALCLRGRRWKGWNGASSQPQRGVLLSGMEDLSMSGPMILTPPAFSVSQMSLSNHFPLKNKKTKNDKEKKVWCVWVKWKPSLWVDYFLSHCFSNILAKPLFSRTPPPPSRCYPTCFLPWSVTIWFLLALKSNPCFFQNLWLSLVQIPNETSRKNTILYMHVHMQYWGHYTMFAVC